MCVQKKSVIALFGSSCSGKTVIAKALSVRLSLPLRHCGDCVRATANSIGKAIDELSLDNHRDVDAETIKWTQKNAPCIVEGRFLDFVFANEIPSSYMVLIFASSEVKLNRLVNRHKRHATVDDTDLADAMDANFRARMYADRLPIRPIAKINNSDRSVESCVQEILDNLPRLPLLDRG